MRINYWHSEGWPEKTGSCEAAGISITEAKKQLRKKGGRAFTAFFDRDGGLLETREIDLKGQIVSLISRMTGKGEKNGIINETQRVDDEEYICRSHLRPTWNGKVDVCLV